MTKPPYSGFILSYYSILLYWGKPLLTTGYIITYSTKPYSDYLYSL